MTVQGLMEAVEGGQWDPKETPLKGREMSTGLSRCLTQEGHVPKGTASSASPNPPIPLLSPRALDAQAQSAAGEPGSCQGLTPVI